MRSVVIAVVAVLVTLGVPAAAAPTTPAPVGAAAASVTGARAGTDEAATGGTRSPGTAVPVARGTDGGLGTGWPVDTVALAWDGTRYTTADASFVGVPVTVPGDRAWRTLEVRNDGPAAGTLRAWVQQVDLGEPRGDAFYEDLTLFWTTTSGSGNASFDELAAAARTQVVEVDLAPGATTAMTVGYELPLEGTSGNRAQAGPLSASFVVHLEIAGDTGEPAVRPGVLAMTGAGLLPAALVAGGAVAAGVLLLALVRRRRRSAAPAGSDG